MDLILAILLWAQSMMPFGQYSTPEYEAKVQQNQAIIDSVLADPMLRNQVADEWGVVVPTVVIYD